MYELIKKLDLMIHDDPVCHVKFSDIDKVLHSRNDGSLKLFNDAIYGQTTLVDGAYAWDVEKIFRRIIK